MRHRITHTRREGKAGAERFVSNIAVRIVAVQRFIRPKVCISQTGPGSLLQMTGSYGTIDASALLDGFADLTKRGAKKTVDIRSSTVVAE